IEGAKRSGERALAIARRLGDRIEEACSLRLLGLTAAEAGDLPSAQERLGEASRILLSIGKRYELARLNLGAGLAWRRRARKGKSRGILDEPPTRRRRPGARSGFPRMPRTRCSGRKSLRSNPARSRRGTPRS